MKKEFKPDDLIKWNIISLLFCNHRMSITKLRVPKKHLEAITALKETIQKWYDIFVKQ
jgi:hypothetical protein